MLPDHLYSGFCTQAFLSSLHPIRQFDPRIADDDSGKSQESKEAWLASHNIGIDHGDPWGRLDGLDGLGPAVAALGRIASGSQTAPPRQRAASKSAPGGRAASTG